MFFVLLIRRQIPRPTSLASEWLINGIVPPTWPLALTSDQRRHSAISARSFSYLSGRRSAQFYETITYQCNEKPLHLPLQLIILIYINNTLK